MQRRLSPHHIFSHLLRLPSLQLHPLCPAFFIFQSLTSSHAFRSVATLQPVRFFSPFSSCSEVPHRPLSSLEMENMYREDHGHANSESKLYFDIGKSVVSRCSYLWASEPETFLDKSSLQDLLKLHGDIIPESTRHLWRVTTVRPIDFLEILMDLESGDLSIRQVNFLLKLFRWAEKQSADFNHLPRTYEIMVSVLTHAQMHEAAESVLMEADTREPCSNAGPLFSGIIKGYAECCKSENSLTLFDKARERGIIPSASSYQALLSLLTKMKNVQLVTKVYLDMIDVGLASFSDDIILNIVVVGLMKNEKTIEAITLLRQLRGFGIQPGHFTLSAIAEGFCSKKDFDDMFNFLEEWEHVPEVHICNQIVSSLCKDLDTQESWSFIQRMEVLGFNPDSITFSILVCHSCKTRNLKDAFLYLSECLSRGITPTVYIYNALIGGVFKEGLHRHAKDVLEDMLEKGVVPNQTTFRILLAGFCKYRKFDQVKEVLADMRNQSLISLTSLEDSLSKVLKFLRLDNLEVKIKRDNNVGIPRSEFFDCLGNGLYLDTNVEEYENSLSGIMDSAIIPDFEFLLMRKIYKVDVKNALRVKDELIQWGQDLSLPAYAKLLKHLFATPGQIKEASNLLDSMSELFEKLDAETLNSLLQTLSKNKLVDNAMIILERLFNRKLKVDGESFMVLVVGLCKERDIGGLRKCCYLAQINNWLPSFENIRPLFNRLCMWGLIKEVLELFTRMLGNYPDMVSSLSVVLLKELCMTGYTNVGCIIIEELLQRNIVMDHAPYVYIGLGFLKEKKLVESLGILDIILNKNLTMSVDACQKFIPLLIQSNRIGEAIALRQSALTRKRDSGIFIYSVVLSELCKRRKLSETLFQLQDMLLNKMLPDDNDLNVLLQVFSLENDIQKSCATLGTLIRVHGNLSISGYRSLVRQMLLNGLISHALRLRDIIQQKDKSEELILYNILIFHLFQTGNGSIVESILKDMQDKHIFPDNNTYDFLVHGFHRCGKVLKSIEALNTIICNGWRPRSRSLRIVICELCNDGKVERAVQLSRVMDQNKWNLNSVIQNTLARALYLHVGSLEAESFLDKVDKEGLIPMKVDYNNLIPLFCKQSRMKKAVDLLNLMLKKGNTPSEVSYNSVVHGFCLCNAFDQALNFHAEMVNKNLRPSEESCYALVNGLCTNGRTDDARKILRTMHQFGTTITYNIYNLVLNSHYRSNNVEKASEFLHEMQQAGHSPNFETHWCLISNLNSLEKKDDNDGQSILSSLLSGTDKNSKGKSASIFKFKFQSS